MSAPTIHPLRQLVQPGIDVLRRLWLPFVAVQLTGLLLVVSYFHSSTVAAWCDAAGRMKSAGGLPFSAAAMAFAAGIVPEIFKTLTGVDRAWDRNRLTTILHNLVVFAISGLTVDLLYTGLALWLGESREVRVIVTKVLIDQLGYTPFWAMPFLAFSYALRNHKYHVVRTLKSIDRGWYGREAAPVLVVCWAYWIPMVTLAYLLPPTLTFVYSLVASAASSTLLVAVASRKRTLTAAPSVP